ncbi:SpoIIE family protein phosphatase [Streptomyces sodiiphilus]|uniref:SpoIIE family protein phosphatase n=1 Tax=Streptomyces sodiiphilus TaxID=226217 RepID=A0ABN2NZZ6_9ACTN
MARRPRRERRPDPQPLRGTGSLRRLTGTPLEVYFEILPLPPGSQACALVTVMPAALARRRQEDQALVRALFAQRRVGMAIHDTEIRIVRVNITHDVPAWEESARAGITPRVPLELVMVPRDAQAVKEQLRRVADTGEPLIDWEHSARLLDSPQRERVISVSAFRLQDENGALMGVAAVFTDVTEQHVAQRRLSLLYTASQRLGRSLDTVRNCEELAGVLVPGFADLAAVDLTDEVVSGDEPGDFVSGRSLLRRVATVPDDGWPGEIYGTGDTFPLRELESEKLREGRVLVVADLAWLRARLASDEQRSRLVLPGRAASMMVVPLRARGLVLGALVLWRTAERAAFDPGDAELAQEVASRAALSVDNARRYTREHRTVETLQRSLLPEPVTEVSAAEAAGTYVPAGTAAGIGGSWFDVIPLSSARVAFVVGDVPGHGLAATATMGRLRTAVQTLADLDLAPEELLARLDDLALRLSEAADPAAGSGIQGASCVYCVYDPVTGCCTVAGAGRPPPVFARPGEGSAEYVPLRPGQPLGVDGLPSEQYEVRLPPGSVLAFCTDELVKQAGGSTSDGMERLRVKVGAAAAAYAAPSEIARVVLGDLLTGEPPANDVALLVARVRSLPEGSSVAWEFPADPAVVARTRDLVLGQLAQWGLEELSFSTELIASELVTNSIRYAGGPVGLRLIKDETLICEVSDPSQTQPHLRRARPTDEGGRGLFLIAQLAHRWGSRYTQTGKTIWTEQLLHGAEA